MNPGTQKALTIARRTRKNLDFILTAKKNGDEVEEFTQLLNSMLGMIICLDSEHPLGSEVTWDTIESLGLKAVSINENEKSETMPKLELSGSFNKLIKNLRNAFAHNNFDLIGNPIASIKVWNYKLGVLHNECNRCWQATISEQELSQLSNLYLEYLEKTQGPEEEEEEDA